jgi:hypothetical protein
MNPEAQSSVEVHVVLQCGSGKPHDASSRAKGPHCISSVHTPSFTDPFATEQASQEPSSQALLQQTPSTQ